MTFRLKPITDVSLEVQNLYSRARLLNCLYIMITGQISLNRYLHTYAKYSILFRFKVAFEFRIPHV